ncbi:MAG: 30S ribosomal protein S8 [Candidatus Hydrogenedentes bacterium]|nr:30S ribosomal protein S8 [Candidatus Hydrogenedentota bacterium]
MSMSDPIADMLTRMRNALQGKQARVDIPASTLKERVCAVLKQEGYIEEYKLVEGEHQGVLQVTLKYEPNRKPVIQGIKRVSKPSLRVYVQCDDIRPVRSGLGISIMSTSKGVMTGKEARHNKLGGEVLCEVW